jgi:RNase H-fold protein (predicted Holliday junction resolvase)
VRSGGLDVGDRRIGVAISDELEWTARRRCVISRTQLDAKPDIHA